MLFDDTYKTIAACSSSTYNEKGSKFIASIWPLKNIDDYKEILQNSRNEHPKARHHCWALRQSSDTSVFKLSDDGEPSGSAGRPILNTLRSADITDVFAVVVRYFGGTLLGIPGLIHAYKTSTQMALNEANIIEKSIQELYQIEFKYEQMNDIMRIIKDDDLDIIKQEFDNICNLKIAVRKSISERICQKIKNIPNTQLRFLNLY